ncbi:MAG: hypothetical protein ACTIL2_10170 [Corynebacterium sp.]|uniref:hypothetical protein n=1 Tax=Corynebacterium sp. TaxID=1720 RepID=UPI003F994C9E
MTTNRTSDIDRIGARIYERGGPSETVSSEPNETARLFPTATDMSAAAVDSVARRIYGDW